MAEENYLLRVIVRTTPEYKGHIAAKLFSEKNEELASAPITINTSGEWNDIKIKIKANGTAAKGKLALVFDAPGKIWLDYVSLFPENTFNQRSNGLRKDVAQMLVGLKPAFVRWPGGCVVEGISLENRFEWKKHWVTPLHVPENIVLGDTGVLMDSDIMKCFNSVKISMPRQCMCVMSVWDASFVWEMPVRKIKLIFT